MIWQKQANEDFKCLEKLSCNFRWNKELNLNPLYPGLEKQCGFKVKLNDY